MSDGVKVTFVMNLKPEVAEQFCSGLPGMLPDTRAFAGCRNVNFYRNNADPNKIILIEEWDSQEAYEKYLAWRAETMEGTSLLDLLTTPSGPEYWHLAG